MAGKKLWRGLTTITGSLLIISLTATGVAESRASFLNTRLGTSNYVMTGGDPEADSNYFEAEFASVEEVMAAKQELAEQIGAEGAVLLKNNGALPLDKSSEKVTLWGFNSASPILGGMMGSSPVAAEGQTAYGIEEALIERGYSVNEDMMAFYADSSMDQFRMQSNLFGNVMYGHALSVAFDATYEPAATYFVGEAPVSLYSDELTSSADGSAAIVVISRDSSEAADYEPGMTCSSPEDSFERPLALSENEKAVIELAKAHSTKVIVVLNADNPLEIDELKKDEDVDAILWAGEPGNYGFLGVADVLDGTVSPSGHLPDTYAVSSLSAPAMVNYGLFMYENNSQVSTDMTDHVHYGDWYVAETEGIYVGYKYYETRYEDAVLGQGSADSAAGSSTGKAWSYADEISYPFGYGLSYTTFEQKLDSIDLKVGEVGTATVTVTNTGDVAGKSVAQVYVQAPYTAGGLEKAAVQLVNFGKTGILQPGESETLTIEIDPQYFASYDDTLTKADGTTGAWVLDAGDYYFALGNGAHEAINNILAVKRGTEDGLVMSTDAEQINTEAVAVWNLAETDSETYSVNVQNALQDMELENQIGEAVEYTTRSDWNLGWNPVTGITANEKMLVDLRNETWKFTENGEGLVYGVDNGLALIDFIELDENGKAAGALDINDEKWDKLLEQLTLDETINFVENGGDDFENLDTVSYKRTFAQDGPVGIAYDQVAGYSVKWNPSQSSMPTYVAPDHPAAHASMAVMPTEPVVAATFNQELVEREGELFGEDGLWANVQAQFAPGLNLHRAVYCARNHEYYSEDPMLTCMMGIAVCKGGLSKGMMMEPKHFAFNHQELNRVGVSTFVTEQAGRENELRGFQGCLAGNYAGGLMTAFNRAGLIYAGSHEGLQVQILRNEWGYDGWIVTDMIGGPNYQQWIGVVFGGGGTCLGSASTYNNSVIGTMESHRAEIEKDTEFQAKMRQAIKYYLHQEVESAAMNGVTVGSSMEYVRTWWQNAFLAFEVCSGILTLLFAALYIRSLRKKNA